MKATFDNFLNSADFSPQSRRAFRSDLRNFAGWFETKNKERFSLHRITTCDVVDFRNHLQKIEKKAVATINRNLVTVRRFLDWAAEQGLISSNPA